MPERSDVERLRRLTQFIPEFRKYSETEEDFGRVVVDGSFHAEYPNVLDSFLRQLRQDEWLQGGYSGEEGQRYRENPARIEEADLETLQRLLVYCSRGERFSTGFWKEAVEGGFLLGILRRLRDIQYRLEDRAETE